MSKGKPGLIETAKAYGRVNGRTRIYTPEELDLALAWAHNQVGAAQCARALGMGEHDPRKIYDWLLYALRQAIREGRLAPRRSTT